MPENQIYEKIFKLVPDLKRITHRSMQSPGYMDLNVNVLVRRSDGMRISFSHYYQHRSGDLIPDPDMEIEIDFTTKTARAATYQDSILYQEAATAPELQADLNRFLNQWLTNLENQGFGQERGQGRGR